MFIGHYPAALVARAVRPALPLWHLFVAVQLLDYIWAVLVLTGVEKLRVTKGFMPASILDLHYMPWSHSLYAALGWAVLAGLVYAACRKSHRIRAGLIIAAAVFSHWLLDLVAHGPDLLIWPGMEKAGFGLWNSLLWTQLVELGGLALGFAIYIAVTVPLRPWGRILPWLLLAFMALVQIYNHLPVDHPPAVPVFAVTALLAYSLLALLAWLVDRTRQAVWMQ